MNGESFQLCHATRTDEQLAFLICSAAQVPKIRLQRVVVYGPFLSLIPVLTWLTCSLLQSLILPRYGTPIAQMGVCLV